MTSSQQAISTSPREKSGWWGGVQQSVVNKYRAFKHFLGIHDVNLNTPSKQGNFLVYPCKKCNVNCTMEDAIAQKMLFTAEACLWIALSFICIYFWGWWSALIIPIYTARRMYKLKTRWAVKAEIDVRLYFFVQKKRNFFQSFFFGFILHQLWFQGFLLLFQFLIHSNSSNSLWRSYRLPLWFL